MMTHLMQFGRVEMNVVATAIALPTVAGAALIGMTGSSVGVGALYLVGVGSAARFGSRRAGLAAGLLAIGLINFFFVAPHRSFSLPSVNELVLYSCLLGLAFLFGQASVVRQVPMLGNNAAGAAAQRVKTDKAGVEYERELRDGAMLAQWCIDELRATGTHERLGWLLSDAIERGSVSGREIGFAGHLARELTRNARSIPDDQSGDVDQCRVGVDLDGRVDPAPVGRQ